MSDWEPATEAEAALREALAASDQEHYFRVLSRAELLLPVSADALAGRAPMGWGTWTTGNRTHVLAFTSPVALHACFQEAAGSYRTLPFQQLAADWPNYEWWLAVNPGLPIESYLPSWFVSQLTRGDVRLPGRTMGARARMSQSDLSAALSGRVRATGPAGPAPTATASAPIPHGPGGIAPPQDPFVETVEAEIIDLPETEYAPAGGTARVAEPAPDIAGRYGSPPIVPGYGAPAAYGTPPQGGAPTGGPPYSGASSSGPSYGGESSGGAFPGGASHSGASFGGPEPGLGSRLAEAVAAATRQDLDDRRFDEPTIIAPMRPSSRPTPTFTESGRVRDPLSETIRVREAFAENGRVRETLDAEIVAADGPTAGPVKPGAPSGPPGFVPANETESNLLAAAESGNTDAFLSTLLLARIIVPVPEGTPTGSHPREHSFPWRIEEHYDQRHIAVFTSPERLSEHPISRYGREMTSVSLRFVQLIGAWPDDAIGFAINPGSPVGATLPGSQIVALASWAAEVGLRDEPSAELALAPKRNESTPSSVAGVAGAPTAGAERATVMQRAIPHEQVVFYLERGYDRVSGFVNRASEIAHITTPKSLYRALGLVYGGSPFAEDDAEVHVLRWISHRADLYRLPYGGQHEAGMRAMQGWVIERAPYRGNGFAPGETVVVAEFKVDSIRLPHGAQLWRLSKDGIETLLATFDADATRWVPAPPGFSGGLYA